MKSLQAHTELFVPPQRVYQAWLSTSDMGLITGAPAVIEPWVGGVYSLYGGAVTGQFVFLKQDEVIAQTWRTEDFEQRDEDSRLELRLTPSAAGCRLQVTQTHIPPRSHQQFIHAWTKVVLPGLKAWAAPTLH